MHVSECSLGNLVVIKPGTAFNEDPWILYNEPPLDKYIKFWDSETGVCLKDIVMEVIHSGLLWIPQYKKYLCQIYSLPVVHTKDL